MDIRVGTGIDFHRLEHNRDRKLIIGGVVIPGDLALVGHSDADILLHALCDALLGALALGDIGRFFPDNDPKNKDLDSTVIAEHTLSLMKSKCYQIMNCDITIIGEQPKMYPYRDAIQERIAELLSIEKERVGVKATTTEKMGALGREEGIACITSVLLIKA